jgi:hypothetical protein
MKFSKAWTVVWRPNMKVHMLQGPSVATSRRPHVTRRHLGLNKDPSTLMPAGCVSLEDLPKTHHLQSRSHIPGGGRRP